MHPLGQRGGPRGEPGGQGEPNQKSFPVFSLSWLSFSCRSHEEQRLKKSLPKSLDLLGLVSVLATPSCTNLRGGAFCDVEATFLSGEISRSLCTRRRDPGLQVPPRGLSGAPQ